MGRITYLFCLCLGLLVSASAWAGGVVGAKAMGMGDAFAAIADDPTAIWFNPAGIAFQDRVAVTAGNNTFIVDQSYTLNGASWQPDTPIAYTPFGFFSIPVPESPITFGLGVTVPFGLGADWSGSGAPFSLISAGTDSVTKTALDMFSVNPVLALRFNDHLSLAVGVMYYRVREVNINNHALLITGSGDGWGGNVALLYRSELFNVGVSYRSRVTVDFKGTVVSGPVLATPLLAGGAGVPLGTTVGATSSATFPDLLSIAVAFHPAENWLLTLQADWTNWKTFDQLDVRFSSPLAGDINPFTGRPVAISNTSFALQRKSIWTWRLGTEWAFAADQRLRFGYIFDPTPENDLYFSPSSPDSDHHVFTLGYGFDLTADLTIDAAYALVLFKDRRQSLSGLKSGTSPLYNGLYKTRLHILTASATYRF